MWLSYNRGAQPPPMKAAVLAAVLCCAASLSSQTPIVVSQTPSGTSSLLGDRLTGIRWQVAGSVGLGSISFPMFVNHTITKTTGLKSSFSDVRDVESTGLAAEVQAWPLFSERWGIGLVGGVTEGLFSANQYTTG